MIVKATHNNISYLPNTLRNYAWTQDGLTGDLDISPGKHYIVYAIWKNQDGKRYFVHTDTMNIQSLW